MKAGFYPRLAWTGMRRNRQLYMPWLLTCVGMAAMEYIILFLSDMPALDAMPGGAWLRWVLQMGVSIVALFSVLFLFYTHSFLYRRRMKEFGLYNILGMGRWSLGWILFWEMGISAALSLTAGIGLGTALSKLAELLLTRMVGGETTYQLGFSYRGAKHTAILFALIFGLILLHSLVQLHRTSAVALLRSENSGEKPPRANWLLGLGGTVLLAAAYLIALKIEDPVSALLWFFAAVALVIAATYLLFTAGAVLLCRVLQKSRRYYYQSAHFVSVSSLAYRMKRNGAGLASICILATMVLVMLSSTACLYLGVEDVLVSRYPREINLSYDCDTLQTLEDEAIHPLRAMVEEAAAQHGAQTDNVRDYRSAIISGMLTDGVLEPAPEQADLKVFNPYADVYTVCFVPLEDYNRMTGSGETLQPGEALVYVTRGAYAQDTFAVRDLVAFSVRGRLDGFPLEKDSTFQAFSTLFVVVPDLRAIEPVLSITYAASSRSMMELQWNFCFDTALGEAAEEELAQALSTRLEAAGVKLERRSTNRSTVYAMNGGLFFLGVILSAVFLLATVLMIYYKQISEGYEDRSRFEIMQKVGMTRRDIRRSINSQMLTVFLSPLLAAGLHLTFAFPVICKLLYLFNLLNTQLLVETTLASFAVFALFYVLVYRITSNAYYRLVSEES